MLTEYAELRGPVPMIPRYVLGPWITDFNLEYLPGTVESTQPAFQRYNEQQLKQEISGFRQNRIPCRFRTRRFVAWTAVTFAGCGTIRRPAQTRPFRRSTHTIPLNDQCQRNSGQHPMSDSRMTWVSRWRK